MLGRYGFSGIYLAVGATDLRKAINGLSVIVQESFGLDPFNQSLYVFCNRKKNLIKILHWENTGFWLYIKRLEKGFFQWPSNVTSQKSIMISERELS